MMEERKQLKQRYRDMDKNETKELRNLQIQDQLKTRELHDLKDEVLRQALNQGSQLRTEIMNDRSKQRQAHIAELKNMQAKNIVGVSYSEDPEVSMDWSGAQESIHQINLQPHQLHQRDEKKIVREEPLRSNEEQKRNVKSQRYVQEIVKAESSKIERPYKKIFNFQNNPNRPCFAFGDNRLQRVDAIFSNLMKKNEEEENVFPDSIIHQNSLIDDQPSFINEKDRDPRIPNGMNAVFEERKEQGTPGQFESNRYLLEESKNFNEVIRQSSGLNDIRSQFSGISGSKSSLCNVDSTDPKVLQAFIIIQQENAHDESILTEPLQKRAAERNQQQQVQEEKANFIDADTSLNIRNLEKGLIGNDSDIMGQSFIQEGKEPDNSQLLEESFDHQNFKKLEDEKEVRESAVKRSQNQPQDPDETPNDSYSQIQQDLDLFDMLDVALKERGEFEDLKSQRTNVDQRKKISEMIQDNSDQLKIYNISKVKGEIKGLQAKLGDQVYLISTQDIIRLEVMPTDFYPTLCEALERVDFDQNNLSLN
ncbi:hypothetical protein FGO68_gene4966 [Halteria grandinella]|uniref:Uncharacterized protein n=1 Tax=Halteria grandinella TaxID=5974 RepID=A0A8J8NFJ4_HALGN|nr:hypothetical protein FGO68_gene4966 [Halteria grandinella]